ncbi:hypothetical protein ACLRAA_11305 [Gallibacterium anatis]
MPFKTSHRYSLVYREAFAAIAMSSSLPSSLALLAQPAATV